MIVEKLSNVDRNVFHLDRADLDRIQKAINDLKLPAAADGARQTTFRDGFMPRRLAVSSDITDMPDPVSSTNRSGSL